MKRPLAGQKRSRQSFRFRGLGGDGSSGRDHKGELEKKKEGGHSPCGRWILMAMRADLMEKEQPKRNMASDISGITIGK